MKRRHLGTLRVDEACDAAKSVACANINGAIFVLFPVPHSSCDKTRCMNNRRYIEDKFKQFLGSKSAILKEHVLSRT